MGMKMEHSSRRNRALAVSAGLLLVAVSCSNGSDDGDGDSFEENEVADDSANMRNWTDVCEVFDPDAVTEQLHVESYDEGPTHLGIDQGNFPGALKCNSTWDLPDYPDTEDWGDLNGRSYMVLVPYNSPAEASEGYQDMYEDAAQTLRDLPEKEQVVDREIEGDWDQGAILASVGSNTRTQFFYLNDSYYVYIEIGYKPDPGVSEGLAYSDMDTFENPTYEFTPPELADWAETEYVPQLHETITAKLEEDH